jgi:hypothetical protein
VKDSNGATLGVYSNGVLRDVGGTIVQVPVSETTGFNNSNYILELYFTSTDCSGSPLRTLDSGLVKSGTIIGTTLHFAASSGASTTTNSRLIKNSSAQSQFVCDTFLGGGTFVAPDSCCKSMSVTQSVAPGLTDDLIAFVPPFHLE